MAKILVVDDERAIRRSLREVLEFEKHEVEEAEDGNTALTLALKNNYDVILSDVKMPKLDGIELLTKLSQNDWPGAVVVMSGHGTIETAVEAVKKGAFDYLAKPIDLNRLLVTIRNAVEKKDLVSETRTLRRRAGKGAEMIGSSSALQSVRDIIEKVGPTDARVLITGSNGSGKELVARLIHEKSQRSAGPLVEVNCAAIPSELIESELFGHEKGSFTSAIAQRKGKFELAENGTLFLDEIGDMSHSAQAKVLRALQENRITRVGGDKEIKVNVRVIAATNKDLQQEIAKGNFREDLYHRIAVIVIRVPSLDDRKEDLPVLADYFLTTICKEMGIARKSISREALDTLAARKWPGNVREFRNVMERLIILGGKEIGADDVKSFA